VQEKTFSSSSPDGAFNLHYKLWGDEMDHTLVCVHGLTGNSLDFRPLAENLAPKGWRIAAIDMAGRGLSDYHDDPAHYCFAQYMNDLQNFLEVIGCNAPASCSWLGVSMGGLLGIRMAGQENSPIGHLILSDVGPEVPQFDLDFISKVIKLSPEYNDPLEAIPILKMAKGTAYSRGPMNDEEWLYLATTSLKKRESDGKYIRNFDPQIAVMFDKEPLGEEELWQYWKNITQPVSALRGELSTLFPIKTLEKMRAEKKGHGVIHHTIAESGHVPSLYRDDQINLIEQLLRRGQEAQAE